MTPLRDSDRKIPWRFESSVVGRQGFEPRTPGLEAWSRAFIVDRECPPGAWIWTNVSAFDFQRSLSTLLSKGRCWGTDRLPPRVLRDGQSGATKLSNNYLCGINTNFDQSRPFFVRRHLVTLAHALQDYLTTLTDTYSLMVMWCVSAGQAERDGYDSEILFLSHILNRDDVNIPQHAWYQVIPHNLANFN